MANKITLTRENRYIETPFTVNVTGTDLKGKYIAVNCSDGRLGEGTWDIEVVSKKITSNTSFSFTYTLTQSELNNIYANTINTSQLRMNIIVYETSTGPSITSYSFVTYIKPISPTFIENPIYEVIDNTSLSFTNNNKTIINGISSIEISNINFEAHKYAEPKYIIINDTQYSYTQEDIDDQKIITINNFSNSDKKLDIKIVDTRGFSKTLTIADFTNFKSYHRPVIRELLVERDGITATTKLSLKGYYTEGYEEGIEPLTPSYKYQEITSSGDEPINNGITPLTVTRTITDEWQDYLDILEEYNNPHYIINEDETDTRYGYEFYTVANWSAPFGANVNKLFQKALKYNNKYTQEYLKNDTDTSTLSKYCISGGYNGSWKNFWGDTLKEIQKTMYGSYIYSGQDKDYGNGGNYQFEIEATIIKGDIVEGFTLDKTFYIWTYINAGTNKESVLMKILPTAIPAIDVFKDKVALHGLYDDTISDSDIQLWGNIFLNGYQLNNKFILQAIKTSDTTTYSTNYNYFSPFNGDGDASVDISNTDKLTFGKRSVTYGDRTNNSVYGITIGSDIHMIKVNYSVRFFNNYTSNVPMNVSIYRVRNNTAEIIYGTSSTMLSNGRETLTGDYCFEVEEGDFIFIGGYRATKTANVDVITTNNATKMIIETIN